MSLTALIIGVIAQIVFAGLQGLIVVFSGSAIANHSELTLFQDRLLSSLMLLLPGISLATAGLLVVGYLSAAPRHGCPTSGTCCRWWRSGCICCSCCA